MTAQPKTAARGRIAAMRYGGIIVAILIVFAIAIGSGWRRMVVTPGPDLRDARSALNGRRLSESESIARAWLKLHPKDSAAMIVLAEALQRQGQLTEAIEIYNHVPVDASEKSVSALMASASISIHLGRLAEAETNLQKIVAPKFHTTVIDNLWVRLLSLAGRRWESMPYLRRVLKVNPDPFMTLTFLANPEEMPAPPEELFAKMFRVGDPLGSLGCARVAASLGRVEQAENLVRVCLEKRPDLTEAHVLQGHLLLDAGDFNEFLRWDRDLAKVHDEHPSVWYLRGRYHQEQGDRQMAIRCFWEVLRRQPDHDRSTYRLGQLLAAEGRESDAKTFFDCAKRETRLIELTVAMFEHRGSEKGTTECAQLTHELGRLHECRAWCQHALSVSPGNEAVLKLLERLSRELREDTPWVLPANDLAARFDLSSYPLPKSIAPSVTPQNTVSNARTEPSRIAFVDDTRRTGLEFTYHNGDDPTSEGKRMFEYTGGGVAAFDFDGDGWCDLYFTQGAAWPPNPSRREFVDAVFRNVAGERMQNVTTEMGITDVGFGQGVSSGDFDNDGFADLYVANIDGNRLYQNCGDGTFVDVTESSGLGKHAHWTTSCLLADLNGDSLPDVYDVTFLEASDIFSRICVGDSGKARSCAPAGFPAAPDHVYINLGDGSFRDATQEWGFDAPNGDGLGIVAADFDETGTISIFIANDGRANFFFAPKSGVGGSVHWDEIGVESGLAYDESGAAQACMGVAAGDANNDGLVDLFVTNFYNESNTLYMNLGGRSFIDRARSTGLRAPSLLLLGFGTQFLDADQDGFEDLLVVNGHVDDFRFKQIPYKMQPQFFQNVGARFVERSGKEIGPFFDQPRLGRGLARFDWNRDGLNDLAISNLEDPAALLTNRTERAGHRVGLKLVGTSKSRDAIGTRVIVKAGQNRLTRQLTGGDGYMATNERRLEFGLADFAGNVEIEVLWIGGARETFERIPTDGEYLAIEGRGALIPLRVN